MLQNSRLFGLSPPVIQNCVGFVRGCTNIGRTLNRTPYRMERIKKKDHSEVMAFVAENYFKDEPLIRSLHLSGCPPEPELYKLVDSFVRQGMSIKCVDTKTETIVGVSVNKRLTPLDEAKVKEAHQRCISLDSKRLLEAWVLMNTAPGLFNRFNDSEIFDIALGAVRRDKRNQGLGQQLVEASLCFGKELNYAIASMDCTNKFSAIIARNLGMQLVWEYPFRLVTHQNLTCTYPHSHVQVFIKKLDTNDLAQLCRQETFL